MNVRETRVSTGGFTIVELLIVIAIVGTLMGILLPVLSRARDAANRAVCASNLRSVGQTLQLFKGDNVDRHPLARYMPEPWLSGDKAPPLHRALKDYAEPTSDMYRCPGDPVVYDQPWTDHDGEDHICGMSYQYNLSFVGRDKFGEIRGLQYKETWMHRRIGLEATKAHVVRDFDGGQFETQDGKLVPVDFFHTKRNLLFVDGHVSTRAR